MANPRILVGATTSPAQPVVRRISPADLYYALTRGIDDFTAVPSHAVFLCVIYPLLGILLIGVTLGHSLALLPLAFPIAAGFALVGPLAAIGLYGLSRRRESGLDSANSGRMVREVKRKLRSGGRRQAGLSRELRSSQSCIGTR